MQTKLLVSLACVIFAGSALQASTYYLQSRGGTHGSPPWPIDPYTGAYPLEQIGPDKYLIEDGDGSTSQYSMMAAGADGIDPGDTNNFGTDGSDSNPAPNIRNYAKYGAQVYTLLDTNSMLNDIDDTNLFEACAAINGPTNGLPLLTIVPYGPDGVLIRADNFDYTQTNVNLALLVCDKVETPTWKAIDFNGTSDTQDGWLLQGTVPSSQVTSPMFFQVTNLNRSYNAFFKVIPYAGPQVGIIGTNQPYDTVSNIISLTTQIYDLSGTTNEEFLVDVNGDDTSTRSSLTNNTITIDTKYNPNGLNNVDLTVQGRATVYDYGANTNTPGDTQLLFPSATSIPLDFENVNYLLFQSELADPDIGTNAILFSCGEAEDFTCTITDPGNNQVVASYGGTTPGPVIVEIDWNFTEADGVTPYSNTVYNVTFTASDPDTFTFQNQIAANDGVRRAAGCFITYEQEPTITGEGEFTDEEDQTWLEETLPVLYQLLYDNFGVTQYGTGDIGPYRSFGACQGLIRGSSDIWNDFMAPAMSNSILDFVSGVEYPMYSDLTIGGAHGDGATIGGYAAHTWIPWLHDSFTPMQLTSWLQAPNFAPEWRLRKAAIWACLAGQHPIYTPEKPGPQGQTNDPPDFADGCGIRGQVIQTKSYVHKNSAWIIDNLLPQLIQGPSGYDSTAKVATLADELWVEGPNGYPGGCDPTYCTYWVVRQMRGMYPILVPGADTAFLDDWGYIYLPYTAVQETQIEKLDASGVKGKF